MKGVVVYWSTEREGEMEEEEGRRTTEWTKVE